MFWKALMAVPTSGMSALLALLTPDGAKSHSIATESTQDTWLKIITCAGGARTPVAGVQAIKAARAPRQYAWEGRTGGQPERGKDGRVARQPDRGQSRTRVHASEPLPAMQGNRLLDGCTVCTQRDAKSAQTDRLLDGCTVCTQRDAKSTPTAYCRAGPNQGLFPLSSRAHPRGTC
jgi:hypothetical protein